MNQLEKWQIDANYYADRYCFYNTLILNAPNDKSRKFREERQQYYADKFIEATTGYVESSLPFQYIEK